MKLTTYLVILLLNIGCSFQSENSKSPPATISPKKEIGITNNVGQQKQSGLINDLKELSTVEASESYERVKRQIAIERSQLISKNLPIDSISTLFKKSLVNKIIPFWAGTTWSFEGHTANPKLGSIACGYFVSTTLQDIGLHINRYKLAQQSPINEAKSLAITREVKEFSAASVSENITAIKEIKEYLEEGIHFIGFDQSHVGYILKEKGHLYLIHSNYINAVGVEIEPIEASVVFSSYRKFHLVKLSTNKDLLAYWVTGQSIKIVQKK